MKIAIVVGHNTKATGAYAPDPIGMSEFDFNNLVADEMIRLSQDKFFNFFRGGQKLELFKVNRTAHGTYSAEIDAAYDQVDAQGAAASIELHFNAASPSATGTETLSSGSAKSLAMAGALQKAMLKYLQRPDRGVKVLDSSDRGGRSLHAARATAVLVEPFFSTNSVDRMAANRVGITGFAKMYLEGLIAFAGFQPEDGRGSAELNPRNVFGTLKLETKDLTKEEFFSRNHALLSLAVENINKIQEERAHGEFFVPLTLVDAFALMNAEMGLRGGYVDPKYVHSEKEIGLLPLPSNLVYWNGDDAPLDHSRLSPEQNVSEFLLYLSGIKNKAVGRPFAWGEFYADLFRYPTTVNDPCAQMHLLAAVVHGWFIPQLYQSTPDFGRIAARTVIAYRDPNPVVEALTDAGYKNAVVSNASIVRNRLQNLNAMIALAMPAPIPTPEPVAETKPEPVAETKPEPVAETKPEPVAETKPEPVAETKPEPVAETKPEPVVETKPEPVVETKPEPVVEAKPEPVVEAKPEPVVEAKPEPVVETKPEPVVETKPEPVVETKPEPVVETKPEPVVETKPEPVVETKPEPVVETKPEPVVESQVEPATETNA